MSETLPSVEYFAEQVRRRASSDDEPTIMLLAQVERQIAYYSCLLDVNVGDAVAAQWHVKLATEARHLRAELGITGKRKDGTAPEPLPSARRGT